MGRHGFERSQRGAHRAESLDGGPLTTVGQVLGSTVPKRVPPPKPLRVLVVSGITVGLVLFGYSTTQIYLRFAEPESGPAAPGVVESVVPAPPSTAPGDASPRPDASARAEVAAEEDDAETDQDAQEAPPEEDAAQSADQAAPGRGVPQVSYQTVENSSSNFMGTVTITNGGDSAIDSWELRLGFSDVRVTSAWEAEWESTADGLVARQPSWRGGIDPGQSVTVNFTAEGSAQTPHSCSLNGDSCGL